MSKEAIRIIDDILIVADIPKGVELNLKHVKELLESATRTADKSATEKSEPERTEFPLPFICGECGSKDAATFVDKVDFGQNWDFYAPVRSCKKCGFKWTDHVAERLYEKYMPQAESEAGEFTKELRNMVSDQNFSDATELEIRECLIAAICKKSKEACDIIDRLITENKESLRLKKLAEDYYSVKSKILDKTVEENEKLRKEFDRLTTENKELIKIKEKAYEACSTGNEEAELECIKLCDKLEGGKP